MPPLSANVAVLSDLEKQLIIIGLGLVSFLGVCITGLLALLYRELRSGLDAARRTTADMQGVVTRLAAHHESALAQITTNTNLIQRLSAHLHNLMVAIFVMVRNLHTSPKEQSVVQDAMLEMLDSEMKIRKAEEAENAARAAKAKA